MLNFLKRYMITTPSGFDNIYSPTISEITFTVCSCVNILFTSASGRDRLLDRFTFLAEHHAMQCMTQRVMLHMYYMRLCTKAVVMY